MRESKGVERLSVSVEMAVFCFRILFFVYVLIDLYIEKEMVDHYYLVLLWVLGSMIFPVFFWVPQLVQKRMYFCVFEFLICGSLSIYVMTVNDTYTNMFIISGPTIAFLLVKRYYWLMILLACFPFTQIILKGVIGDQEEPYMYIFSNWLLLGIGFGFNLIINNYKETKKLNKIIEEQNQTLVQYANQIETLTLVEERNRMARDLHDTLGHSFISYILGLDAVQYLVEKDAGQAKKKIEELRDHATSSLDQIRETIHEIGAESDIRLATNFSTIIKEFSEYTNTKVSFQIKGEEFLLHHPMRVALLRCLQECLTNAKRHGHASEVTIILSFLESKVDLMIRDNGKGTHEVEYGFGLRSMKDRIESLNGELRITSSKNEGTTINCIIPFRR